MFRKLFNCSAIYILSTKNRGRYPSTVFCLPMYSWLCPLYHLHCYNDNVWKYINIPRKNNAICNWPHSFSDVVVIHPQCMKLLIVLNVSWLEMKAFKNVVYHEQECLRLIQYTACQAKSISHHYYGYMIVFINMLCKCVYHLKIIRVLWVGVSM